MNLRYKKKGIYGMDKRGFTLAEVLITMGILGVIIALTLPGFVVNNRNAANASKLSATVSDLENTFSTMNAKEQTLDLFETATWQAIDTSLTGSTSSTTVDNVTTELGKYISIIPNQNSKNASSFYSGTKVYSLDSGSTYSFESGKGSQGLALNLKSGAVIFAYLVDNSIEDLEDEAEQEKKIVEAGGSLKFLAGEIMIDVNGIERPNTIGRDIFYFYLGSDGILYPAGGKDAAIYFNVKDNSYTATDIWSESSSKTACTDNKKADNGWGCTARLAENGFKVDY